MNEKDIIDLKAFQSGQLVAYGFRQPYQVILIMVALVFYTMLVIVNMVFMLVKNSS